MVALDRWSTHTVTTVWEFAWTDSAAVALDKWSSYRGGCLNRFDCSNKNNTHALESLHLFLESNYKLVPWFKKLKKMYSFFNWNSFHAIRLSNY